MKGRKAFATTRSENLNRRRCGTTVQTPGLWLLGLLIAATVFVNSAHGTILVGYTREQVVHELGVPDSSAKVGMMESLMYKNGTCVTLENGKVEDIKVRGQIRLGKVVRETTASPTPPVAARALPNVQSPETIVTRSSPAAVATNVVAQQATTDNDDESSQVSEATVEKPKITHQPLAKLQPTRFDVVMDRVRRIIAAMAFALVLFVIATHFFLSYCFKLICEKADKTPGTLVWIPVAQFVPLLRAASMPVWTLALLFVPLVNVGLLFVLWARICIALKKSPWLAATLVVPVVNLAFIPFLAFSRKAEEPGATTQSWPAAKPPTGAPLESHPLSDPSASFPVNASGASG